MITEKGYSKDPTIMPEGIVVTWGKDLIEEKGGLLAFIRFFELNMADESGLWYQKCKNAPKHDIIYVYIIVCNQLRYRCLYGGHSTEKRKAYNGDGISWSSAMIITWPHIILAGPFEKCPFKRELKGFQGFRYTTKLF